MKATRIRLEADCPRCGTLVQLKGKHVGFIQKTVKNIRDTVAHSQVCPTCFDIFTIEFTVGTVSEVIAEISVPASEPDPPKLARILTPEQIAASGPKAKEATPKKRRIVQPQTKADNKRIVSEINAPQSGEKNHKMMGQMPPAARKNRPMIKIDKGSK